MSGCRALNDTEIQAVMDALETDRDKLLFLMGVKTGFRISELLSIKTKDVIGVDGKALTHVKVARGKMKGGKGVSNKNKTKVWVTSRTVPLHQSVRNLIEQMGITAGGEYLFKSRVGENKAISRYQAHNILKAAYGKAMLSGCLATHSMRKTFCEKVYAIYEHDLLKTMKALGHTDIRNTQRYINIDADEVEKGILEA